MPNIKLPPQERRRLQNFMLRPAVIERLKTIAFRRSVRAGKKVSQASVIEEGVMGTKLPPPPTPEQIAAYEAAERERRAERSG